VAIYRSMGRTVQFTRIRTVSSGGVVDEPSVIVDSRDHPHIAWTESDALFGSPQVFSLFDIQGTPLQLTNVTTSTWLNGVVGPLWSIDPSASPELSWDNVGHVASVTFDPVGGLPGPIIEAPPAVAPFPLGAMAFLRDGTGLVPGMTSPYSQGLRTGSLHVVSVNGTTWTDNTVLTFPPDDGSDWSSCLVIDSRDAATLVFVSGASGTARPFVVRSTDRGTSWTSPVELPHRADYSGTSAKVTAAVDERDRVHLLWLDNEGGVWAPLATYTDDGRTFAPADAAGPSFAAELMTGESLGRVSLVVRNGTRYAAWTPVSITVATSPSPP
jgi:hypothetical protein